MSTSTPIVVLVHGAWHGAWCWAALQTELDYRGIASLAIDLPGHGASTAPFTDLAGDAAAVTALCRQIDRPIVLGEFPITRSKRTVPEILDVARANGYAGAFCWRDDEAAQKGSDLFWALSPALTPYREN